MCLCVNVGHRVVFVYCEVERRKDPVNREFRGRRPWGAYVAQSSSPSFVIMLFSVGLENCANGPLAVLSGDILKTCSCRLRYVDLMMVETGKPMPTLYFRG